MFAISFFGLLDIDGVFGMTYMLVVFLVAYWIICWLYNRNARAAIVLSNESVFITGCDTGIGFECAKLCSRLGFNVYAGCLNLDGEGARHLLKMNRVYVVDLDLTDNAKMQRAFEFVNSTLANNGLWALVNNAGILTYGEFEWLTWAQCKKQVDINLLGTLFITKLFLPLLKKRRGRIVTITSVNGIVAYPLQSVYCATKFALEGFCSSLQCEMQRHGVAVVNIQLGDFAKLTNIMAKHEEEAQKMWETLNVCRNHEDSEYFWHIQSLIKRNCGMTSPKSFADSPLYDDIESVLVCLKPRRRYMCMPFKQKLVFQLISLLPRSFSDALVSYVFCKLTQMQN